MLFHIFDKLTYLPTYLLVLKCGLLKVCLVRGLQMKTIQSEGLIVCAWPGVSLIGRGDVSSVGRIFFAVELSSGHLRYTFDGAGTSRPLLIDVGAGSTLNDNQWGQIPLGSEPR